MSAATPATSESSHAPVADSPAAKPLTRNDFVTPNDVRWCPGCGDYAILNCIQRVFPELGVPREKFVIVSGIGCSSRFPYYMQTYGFHSIHGRAPTVATGIKAANPDLSVWLITGDGDGLSIGGNHLLHVLRRNPNIKILLFNNRVYGLTKGQYSPTSLPGMKTKSTPMGSIDYPVNPIQFALGAEATFVARTMDTNPKHMMAIFKAAHEHRGTAFVEILQNCVIFNDKAWEPVTAKETRDENSLFLEDGEPLRFGKDSSKGIRMRGIHPEIVTLGENANANDADILRHHSREENPLYAHMLAQFAPPDFPLAFGILRSIEDRPTYESLLTAQIDKARAARGPGKIDDLLQGDESWTVE